jgi:hypothetical protein
VSDDKKLAELTKKDLKELASTLFDPISKKSTIIICLIIICATYLLANAKSVSINYDKINFDLINEVSSLKRKLNGLEVSLNAYRKAIESNPKLLAKIEYDISKEILTSQGLKAAPYMNLMKINDNEKKLPQPASNPGN